MLIEVLGPGCARCDQLYDNAVEAVSNFDANVDIKIKKIKDINVFAKKGVFMTPGLVIDGEVVSTGKVLSPETIGAKIKEKL
jgi:small redox-active disulfide protein 2